MTDSRAGRDTRSPPPDHLKLERMAAATMPAPIVPAPDDQQAGNDYHSLSVSTWEASGVENLNDGDKSTGKMSKEQTNTIVSALHISMAAILGALLRIMLAQLFGEECANPGTVGWLKAGSPLCVTADGEALVGGIIFADLPANLLGSFIMGLFQSTKTLELPVDSPLAIVRTNAFFQNWDVMHLAIRTGFCGSLTTFSSWNSEMIVIMFEHGSNLPTRIFKALFGYLIGVETALGSYVFGKKVATWIHRLLHPFNAIEADALMDRRDQGIYINDKLPEFERRFLHELNMENLAVVPDPTRLEILGRWRDHTRDARRVGHPKLSVLVDIETSVLVEGKQIPHRAHGEARSLGWDTDALLEWSMGMPIRGAPVLKNNCFIFTIEFSLGVLGVIYALMICGVLFLQGYTAYWITYRTMCYALLFAPPGALLRWHLAQLNGTLPGSEWFPVGTLAANVLGSILSITTIGLELELPIDAFWAVVSLRALKIGFGGSLSTVSTFVSEVNGFMKSPRTQDKAYLYLFLSLFLSCLFGVVIYALLGITMA